MNTDTINTAIYPTRMHSSAAGTRSRSAQPPLAWRSNMTYTRPGESPMEARERLFRNTGRRGIVIVR